MATTKGRKTDNDDLTPDEVREGDTSGDIPMDPRPGDVTPSNVDESRAVGDPAPEWATGDTVPEVMTTKDQYRAGVIDRLRNNQGPLARTERTSDASAVAVVGPATAWLDNGLREAMRTIEGGASSAVEDIVNQVMTAESTEDILAEQTLLDAEDILGVPLQIWGYKVNESEFQQGMAGYMVIDARRVDTGDDAAFTTGAYKVQAQMLRLGQLKKFPVTAKVVKSAKPTKGGFYPLQLVIA